MKCCREVIAVLDVGKTVAPFTFKTATAEPAGEWTVNGDGDDAQRRQQVNGY